MTESRRASLGESFNSFFRISPALDEASVNDVFFVRHEVYARDLGFEPVNAAQRETDKYDRHALHCLVRTSKEPAHLAGCARLVLTDPAAPEAPLPFEVYCKQTLDRSIIDPAKLPRGKIAEVSRLAVMAEFRKRKGEQGSEAPVADQDFGSTEQPRFPYIPISLYMGAVLMAKQHGIDYLFTLTEPRLAEHFGKLGVNIQPIGEGVEHRGLRVPSVIHVADIPRNLRTLIKPLWSTIEEQMGAVHPLARAS
jgi:N-acyl amino acid synthase of PEP-CTERM/exosortase system